MSPLHRSLPDPSTPVKPRHHKPIPTPSTPVKDFRDRQIAAAFRNMFTKENRENSPLLKLPGELRNAVYREVFDDGNPESLKTLLVCKQIYQEFGLLAFDRTIFKMTCSEDYARAPEKPQNLSTGQQELMKKLRAVYVPPRRALSLWFAKSLKKTLSGYPGINLTHLTIETPLKLVNQVPRPHFQSSHPNILGPYLRLVDNVLGVMNGLKSLEHVDLICTNLDTVSAAFGLMTIMPSSFTDRYIHNREADDLKLTIVPDISVFGRMIVGLKTQFKRTRINWRPKGERYVTLQLIGQGIADEERWQRYWIGPAPAPLPAPGSAA